MNEYTIPCTPEQTRKAFELGAPIDITKQSWGCEIIEINKINYEIPTAEQMLGWLRTKGLAFSITEYHDGFNNYPVFWTVTNKDDKKLYVQHHLCNDTHRDIKEATLAAIDAALDFLINKK